MKVIATVIYIIIKLYFHVILIKPNKEQLILNYINIIKMVIVKIQCVLIQQDHLILHFMIRKIQKLKLKKNKILLKILKISMISYL